MNKIKYAIVRFRLKLVTMIDPYPPVGTAWCIDCEMIGGRGHIMVLDDSKKIEHMHEHLDLYPGAVISVRSMTAKD